MKLQKIQKSVSLGLNIEFDKVVIYSIYLLSVLVPLLIGKPQLLVGSIINTLIVYSTLKYGIKKTIPVLLLPSVTATSMGILFSGATYFLLYVFPFIIISNFILSYFVSKKNLILGVLGILLKGAFLLISYNLMSEIVGLPSIFITSAYLQFATASIGVTLGFVLYHFSKD